MPNGIDHDLWIIDFNFLVGLHILPYASVTKVVVFFSLVTSISYKFVINSAKSFEVIDAS